MCRLTRKTVVLSSESLEAGLKLGDLAFTRFTASNVGDLSVTFSWHQSDTFASYLDRDPMWTGCSCSSRSFVVYEGKI